MHKDGLIYRSNRLVNWCTKLRTALSNLEVNYLNYLNSFFERFIISIIT